MNDLMKKLSQEEMESQLDCFSKEEALDLGLGIIERVKELDKGGIAITIEKNKIAVFSYLMEGAMPENLYWAARKKNVVDRFDKCSMYVEALFKSQGKVFERDGLLDPEFFQATGGAVPIIVKEAGVVGTIAISGLTSEEDHDLCIYGLKQLQKQQSKRRSRE